MAACQAVGGRYVVVIVPASAENRDPEAPVAANRRCVVLDIDAMLLAVDLDGDGHIVLPMPVGGRTVGLGMAVAPLDRGIANTFVVVG
jgi:hypothetical protein